MARARNIKPGFFKNETLVELPFEHRLLFVGLWTLADKSGRLEDRVKRIKMELFPADNVDVEAGMSLLERHGFIQRYEINGVALVQILNFSKHQSPHHTEKSSVLPGPNGELTVKEPEKEVESPKQLRGNPPDSLIPDSLIPEGTAPEPEADIPDGSAKPKGKAAVTLKTFIADCQANGESVIADYQPVLRYSEEVGLPPDMLNLCWAEFKSKYLPGGTQASKKYKDWRLTFLGCVRDNWFKLWWIDDQGGFALTTRGKQAEMAHREAA